MRRVEPGLSSLEAPGEHPGRDSAGAGAQHRGYAFADFYNTATAERCRKRMSAPDFRLGGRLLSVSWAEPKRDEDKHAPGAGPGPGGRMQHAAHPKVAPSPTPVARSSTLHPYLVKQGRSREQARIKQQRCSKCEKESGRKWLRWGRTFRPGSPGSGRSLARCRQLRDAMVLKRLPLCLDPLEGVRAVLIVATEDRVARLPVPLRHSFPGFFLWVPPPYASACAPACAGEVGAREQAAGGHHGGLTAQGF